MDPATITAALNALGWGVYVPVVLAAAGLASHAAAILPQASPSSPAWWRVTRVILDVIGGNYGSAANAPTIAPAAAKPGG